MEGVDVAYAQYVTQEYTGLFEPDTRVRVRAVKARIDAITEYLEGIQERLAE